MVFIVILLTLHVAPLTAADSNRDCKDERFNDIISMPLLDNLQATLRADVDVGGMKKYFTQYINREVKIRVQMAMKRSIEEIIDNRTSEVIDSMRTMSKGQTVQIAMVTTQHLTLDKRIDDIIQKYKAFDNAIKSIEKDIEGFPKFNNRLKKIEQQLKPAKDGIDKLNKDIAKLSILEKNVDDVKQQFSLLNGTVSNINKHISFSVRMKSIIANIEPGSTIVFDDIITNVGNGYSLATGIFEAPTSGIYFFTSTILTKTPSTLEIELRVNGRIEMWMYTNARNLGHNNAANSLVIKLKAGDKVKLVKNKFGARPFYIHLYYSTFSGFLLQADM